MRTLVGKADDDQMKNAWGLLVMVMAGCGGPMAPGAHASDSGGAAGGGSTAPQETGGATGTGGLTQIVGSGGSPENPASNGTGGSLGLSSGGATVIAAGGQPVASAGSGGAGVTTESDSGIGGTPDAGHDSDGATGGTAMQGTGGAQASGGSTTQHCECTVGACCDGCHFSPYGMLCAKNVEVSRYCGSRAGSQCPSISAALFASLENRFCSGVSASCDGHTASAGVTIIGCATGYYCHEIDGGVAARCEPGCN